MTTTTPNDLEQIPLSDVEFSWITNTLRDWTGIELKPGKEALVRGRLERRLRAHGLRSYSEYFRVLRRKEAHEERRIAVDLMTTNETYFFREPQHFELLSGLAAKAARRGRPFRVWSAASSTGEEAYSIAMTLAGILGDDPWEVVGTDLSTRVLATARRALYPLEAAGKIPPDLLRAHCLRGTGQYQGMLTVNAELRSRVSFVQANLIRPLPEVGHFDVVFLRNVLIYFNSETKRDVVERIVATLVGGGTLLVGHAETLSGLGLDLELISPSVYRRREVRT